MYSICFSFNSYMVPARIRVWCFSCVDLLKHTPEVHPDHNTLMKVVEVVKSTLV